MDFGTTMDDINAWPLPKEGIHHATVTDATEVVANKTGEPMMKLELAVDGPTNKAKVFYNLRFIDKTAMIYTKRALEALGVDCKGRTGIDPKELIGRDCDIDIVHNEVEDKRSKQTTTYANVKYLKRPSLLDGRDEDSRHGEPEQE
jgi:hypothetical protein